MNLKKVNLTERAVDNFKKALPYSGKKFLYEVIEMSSEETLKKISSKIKKGSKK